MNSVLFLIFEVATVTVPAAGNILSVLLFRQSTRFLTFKHTSCPEYSTLGHTSSRVFDFSLVGFPEHSTLGNASSRLPRAFNFRGREK